MYFERRTCNITGRPIDAKDRASGQILIARLDENGRATSEVEIIDVCGAARKNGVVDAWLMEQKF
ncbi:small subunit ribosomal protein S21e [Enteropsectra breve]|nr:small subunit ribosomal protein S21e [Enteropsectra breve]